MRTQIAANATELASLTGMERSKCLEALVECDNDVNEAAQKLLGL